jgi:hypothetical protein
VEIEKQKAVLLKALIDNELQENDSDDVKDLEKRS